MGIIIPFGTVTWTNVDFRKKYYYPGPCGVPPLRGDLAYKPSPVMPPAGSTGKVVSWSEKIPGFTGKLARGEFIPYTNYAVSCSSWTHSGMELSPSCWKATYLYRSCQAQFVGSPVGVQQLIANDPPAAATPNLDVLLQRAWADAKSGASQILVDVAERKETYDLLKKVHSRYWDRALRIESLAHKRLRGTTVKDLKRYAGNLQSKALNLLGETWMEYRYGWMPLVYSSKDLAEAFLLFNSGKPKGQQFLVLESSAKEVCNGADGGSSGLSIGWSTYADGMGTYAQRISCTNTQKKTGRAKVAYVVKLQAAKAFDTNLLTLGWELVPFSFVADWLWNVPDILGAHWPISNIDQSTACVSLKTENELTFLYGKPNATNPAITKYGEVSAKSESYVRTVRSDVPLVLEYKPHITWKRCLDATVLLRGLTGKMVAKLARRIGQKLGQF